MEHPIIDITEKYEELRTEHNKLVDENWELRDLVKNYHERLERAQHLIRELTVFAIANVGE